MRRLNLCLVAYVLTAAANGVSAQGQLPPCPGAYNEATWTNCIGEVSARSGATFVGEYKEGKRHGHGTYTYPTGRKYDGEYTYGKRHGQGTYTFPSGEKYVGEFSDDEFNGRGTYTFPDGRKYVGEYKDGKRAGQGTEYRSDGSILQSGIWENGVFVRSQ